LLRAWVAQAATAILWLPQHLRTPYEERDLSSEVADCCTMSYEVGAVKPDAKIAITADDCTRLAAEGSRPP